RGPASRRGGDDLRGRRHLPRRRSRFGARGLGERRARLMRAWLRRAAIAGGGLLTGLVVVVSGIVPIAASSGHWKGTELALHFTMRRSVATHSLGAPEPPPLDDPRLVVVGAGHYETACRPCHGAPDSPMPEVARHMTPHPPWLPDSIESFDDAELFYVI